ncbi:MAG TPA: hypothetical protein VIL84_09265 [Devosiaceae bacterium]
MAKDEYRDTTFAELKKAHPSVRVEALPNLSDEENRQRFLQAYDFQRILVSLVPMLIASVGLTIAALTCLTCFPAETARYSALLDNMWPNLHGSIAATYATIYSPAKAKYYAEIFTLSTLVTLACGALWLVAQVVIIARRDRHWEPRLDVGTPPYSGNWVRYLYNKKAIYLIGIIITFILIASLFGIHVSNDGSLLYPSRNDNIIFSCSKVMIQSLVTFSALGIMFMIVIQYLKLNFIRLTNKNGEKNVR